MKYFARNKRALHDYTILEKLEAGIVLTGEEVKAIRAGQANLTAAYAVVTGGQLSLLNCSISAYRFAYSRGKTAEDRSRRLLVHRRQLNSLIGDVSSKGITLIPLSLYENSKGLIKVELALCKHKKSYERKEEIRERDIERQTRRELRGKYDY